MKKFKKLFAVLLTLAMVLGMSMTTMAAATDTGSIKVTNLTKSVKTEVKIYQVISLDENANNWVVADWAKEIVAGVTNDNQLDYVYVEDKSITDLVAAAREQEAEYTLYDGKDNVITGEVQQNNVPIGSYLVLANDSKSTYNPMIAKVAAYGLDDLITAANPEIVAKAENGYTDKASNDADHIVEVGQEIIYTIKAVVPYAAESFTITDTLVGANFDFVAEDGWKVELDGEEQSIAAPSVTDGKFVLNLDSLLNEDNTNAGKEVVITYKATVNSVDEVTNTAKASNDPSDGFKTVEYTGEATIYKTDDNEVAENRKPLAGAEFAIKNEADEYAVIQNGYITGEWVALPEDADKATFFEDKVITTDATGHATVKGLDVGTYYFEEITAPEGYSLNTKPEKFEINQVDGKEVEEGRNVYVSMGSASMADTKLSALPSTGGIGTTIFTIGGCLIMIIAAALFFSSRKKSEAK